MTIRTAIPAALVATGVLFGASGAAVAEVKGALPDDRMKDIEERLESLEKGIGKNKFKAQGHSIDDGKFSFKLRGRIHYDLAFYDVDDGDTDLVGFGHEMRRARMGFEGSLEKLWKFKIEVDLADNGVSMKDVVLEYKGLPAAISVGQQKVPFSIEELTSSRYDPFIESPAIVETFAPARRRGVTVSWDNDNFLAALGAFAGSGEADNTGIAGQDDDIWIAGRVGAFMNDKDKVAYVGGAVAWQNSNDGTNQRFRARPNRSHVTSTRLVDTGNLNNIDDVIRYNAETFLQYDRVWGQAEWMKVDVNRLGVNPVEPSFNGYYIQAGAFVFGEGELYRPFDAGEIKRPKVYNALELLVSYDDIDLTDKTIIGGEQDTLAFGATWYFNPYVKMMANYTMSDVKRPGNAADNDDPNAFLLRLAAEF